MFDDVNIEQTTGSSAGTAPIGGQTPSPAVGTPNTREGNSDSENSNQPLKESSPLRLANNSNQRGESSAAEPPKNNSASPPEEARKAKIEDIFSEVEKKEKPATFQPKDVSAAPAESYDFPRRSGKKKFLFFILLLFAFGGLAIGGWLGYGWLATKTGLSDKLPWHKEKIKADEESKGLAAEEKDKKEKTKQEKISNKNITPEPKEKSTKDSDQDGLTDEEEMNFGTDVNNLDTDGDGLFDRDEVKIYKTDPLNSDTDGDGYQDGVEVKAGYNPNGTGRLYEVKK